MMAMSQEAGAMAAQVRKGTIHTVLCQNLDRYSEAHISFIAVAAPGLRLKTCRLSSLLFWQYPEFGCVLGGSGHPFEGLEVGHLSS